MFKHLFTQLCVHDADVILLWCEHHVEWVQIRCDTLCPPQLPLLAAGGDPFGMNENSDINKVHRWRGVGRIAAEAGAQGILLCLNQPFSELSLIESLPEFAEQSEETEEPFGFPWLLCDAQTEAITD